MKHSPAPWEVVPLSPNTVGCRNIRNKDGEFCSTHGLADDEEDEANAHLIVAAPDLLHALEQAREHLEYCGYGDSWEHEVAQHHLLPSVISTALNKARGK